jgi:hypothetical protein
MAASATPPSSTVPMWRSSSPRWNAAWKSCAMGPMCRGLGPSALYLQVATGMEARRSSTSCASTSWMSCFMFWSLTIAQPPLVEVR